MSGQPFDCPGYELDGNARIRGLVLPAFLIIIICRARCLVKLLSTVYIVRATFTSDLTERY